MANVLGAFPSSVQGLGRKMLAESRDAEDKEHALLAAGAFEDKFAAKWPKAASKVADSLQSGMPT